MKDTLPRNYNLDGTPHNTPGHIPPILLILPEDVGVVTLPDYAAGWYYCDEAEQVTGPFKKFSEAVAGFKYYCENYEFTTRTTNQGCQRRGHS